MASSAHFCYHGAMDVPIRRRRRLLTGRQLFLLVILMITTSLPVVLLGVYAYRAVYESLTNSTLERRVSLAKLGAATVTERLNRLVDLAVLYSEHEEVVSAVETGKWEEAISPLKLLPSVIPFIDRAFLTDVKGIEKVAFPNDPSVIGRDFSFREWYKGVSREWKPYVSGIYQRAAAPKLNLIAIAVPVFGQSNQRQPIAILVIQTPISSFSSVAEVVDVEGYLYLVDHNGNFVSHPDYKTESEIVSGLNTPPVPTVLSGKAGYLEFFNKRANENELSAYWPISEYNWGAVMTEPTSSAFAARNWGLKQVVIVWAVITCISVLLTFILFRFVMMLTLQREREHAILEYLGEGILVVDRAGKITQTNASAEKIYGFSRQELLGKYAPTFFHLSDLEGKEIPTGEKPFPIVARTMKPFSVEVLMRNKSGNSVPVYIVASPIIYDGEFAGAVAVLSDITERYQLDKAKDEFITTAAHQLNSPLGQIRWNLDLFLKKYASKLAQPAKNMIHDAHDSTISLAALVNDLLVASRVTEDHLQGHPVSFKPTDALRKLIVDLKPFITERKITCTIKEVGEIPPLVLDQLAFRQVFENLVRNAIKYNHKEGNIVIQLKKQESELLISVADTGIGIPKEDFDSLFGKFFRASNVTKNGLSGTGLGLFVVKAYVERWQGKVWIESEQGKGTTVFVRIPIPEI